MSSAYVVVYVWAPFFAKPHVYAVQCVMVTSSQCETEVNTAALCLTASCSLLLASWEPAVTVRCHEIPSVMSHTLWLLLKNSWAVFVWKKLPVIREQAVTEDKPAPLVTFQVVGPFKKPSFVGVWPWSRGRGRGGHRALPLLTHPAHRLTPNGEG